MILSLKIFNIELNQTTFDNLLENMVNCIKERSRLNIIACDFRDLLYFQNKKKINFSNDVVFYPDSSGVFYLTKFLFPGKTKGSKKLVSTDFHFALLNYCTTNNIKIFAYGDTKDTLQKFEKKLNKKNDRVIVGKMDGYTAIDNDLLVKKINYSGADILLVGLGIPRQFEFVYKNHQNLKTPIVITVGALFTFYSKKIKRAPRWIRKLSLEWFYRFILEPKRLFSRYFIEFPRFIIKILIERFKLD